MSYPINRNSLHLMTLTSTVNYAPSVRTAIPLDGTIVSNAGLITFGATSFTINSAGVYSIDARTGENLAAPFETWPSGAFVELILFTSIVNIPQREFGDAGVYTNTNMQLQTSLTAYFSAGSVCSFTYMPFGFTLNRNARLLSLSIFKVSA